MSDMSGPQLRAYQARDISRIRQAMKSGARRVLYQLPTGGGKSVSMSSIMQGTARKKKRVLGLVHRNELVEQLQKHFTNWGFPPHMLTSGESDDPNARVTLASVQTAAKRTLSLYDLILIDEAHHAVAGSWDKVLKEQEKALQIGFTATPLRLDNQPLCDHFDVMVQGPSARELTKQEYLARLRTFKTESAIIKGLRVINGKWDKDEVDKILQPYTKLVLSEWRRIHTCGRPGILFASGIHHSDYVAEAARAEGISAASLHSKLSEKDRRDMLRDYEAGKITILCSSDLIDEGLDVPDTYFVLQARATESLTKHFQQIGRTMRIKSDGSAANYIDMGGNIDRMVKKYGFGLPTDAVEWDLGEPPKPKKENTGILIKSYAPPPEIDPRAIARRAVELKDKFALSGSLEEAISYIEHAKDIIELQRTIARPRGGRLTDPYCIMLCREIFYGDMNYQDGLMLAAEDLGKSDALYSAMNKRQKWTRGDHA